MRVISRSYEMKSVDFGTQKKIKFPRIFGAFSYLYIVTNCSEENEPGLTSEAE